MKVILWTIFAEMFDMKAKYDESDNMLVRATRTFTDKVGDVFGKSLFLLLFHLSEIKVPGGVQWGTPETQFLGGSTTNRVCVSLSLYDTTTIGMLAMHNVPWSSVCDVSVIPG